MERLSFKSTNINKLSPASTVCSAYSVPDETSEISEENISDHGTKSFKKIISAKVLPTSSLASINSSKALTENNSISYGSNNEDSNNSSTANSSLSVKRSQQTRRYTSRSLTRENNFECIPDSGTLSSIRRTSGSDELENYETKKLESRKKLKYREENRRYKNNDDVHSIKFGNLSSRSSQENELSSNYSTDSQESSALDKRSCMIKNSPLINDKHNIKYYIADFEKSKREDILNDPILKQTNLLTDPDNCSKKTKIDGKRFTKNTAVQTIYLEPDHDLLPTFNFLLRDIEENMKGMNEKEAISTIIKTHVELIKKQARREKRILEEWNSAMSDLEERCPLVSFERLKLLLHDNNYSYTF